MITESNTVDFMAERKIRVIGYVTPKRKKQIDRLVEVRGTTLSALINKALSDLLIEVLGEGEL
jgi:hypothetical protein